MISVYVSTYSLYNAHQSLEGIWVDLDDFSSHFEFHLFITEHFNKVEPENTNNHEFMFQDYNHEFPCLPSTLFSEGHISPEVFEFLESNTSEEVAKVFAVLNNYLASSLEEAIKFVEDNYVCEESDFEDYILDYFIDVNGIAEYLVPYLDAEKIARDHSYDYTKVDGYVFRNY